MISLGLGNREARAVPVAYLVIKKFSFHHTGNAHVRLNATGNRLNVK